MTTPGGDRPGLDQVVPVASTTTAPMSARNSTNGK